MGQLFSKENILVLGTMPNEILIGQEKFSKLVFSDWKSWGDCTFLMNNALNNLVIGESCIFNSHDRQNIEKT
jgi:hypothetical protein